MHRGRLLIEVYCVQITGLSPSLAQFNLRQTECQVYSFAKISLACCVDRERAQGMRCSRKTQRPTFPIAEGTSASRHGLHSELM